MTKREVKFGWDVGNGTRYEVEGFVTSVSYDNGFGGSNARGDITLTLDNALVQTHSVPQREVVAMKFKAGDTIVHAKSGSKYTYMGEGTAPYEDEAIVPRRGHVVRSIATNGLFYISDTQLAHYGRPLPETGQRYVSHQNGNSVGVLGVVNGYVIYGANRGTKCVLTVEEFQEMYV